MPKSSASVFFCMTWYPPFAWLGPYPPSFRAYCWMATDRAWAIGNLRKFGAPSAKFPQIANLQWSAVSMSLNPGIHSEVHFAQSRNTFRGSCSISEYIPRFSPARGGQMRALRRWGHIPPLVLTPSLVGLMRVQQGRPDRPVGDIQMG